MTDTDWSAYGSCETCGCVPGWPCHRGKRQLKNAHPGRPKIGQEPYDAAEEEPGPLRRELEEREAEKERRASGGIDESGERLFPAEICGHHGPHPGSVRCVHCDLAAGQLDDPDPLAPSAYAGPTLIGPLIAAGSIPITDDMTKEETVAGASFTLENAERYPSNPTGKRRVDAEVPRDIDRDRYDRPKLVRAELMDGAWQISPTGEVEGFTRASTLGNALESSEGLSIWRGGMIVYGMSRRKDLVLAAQAIPGTDDKKRHRRPLYAIADQAKEAAEASSAATVGTALHALTDQADRGNLTVDIGEYQSVLDIYLERMTGWKVVQSETFVVSDYFHAAGSFDRLITPLEPMALVDQETGEIITVIMPGDLIVVDLKTSTTADYFGAKFFAQLAVYVTGALYDRDPESPTYGRRTPLGQRTDFALILHIPQGGDADGEPVADWHWLDMRAGLALAQLACVVLETRKKRFTRTHMRPVLAVPAPSVEVTGVLRATDGTATVTRTALPARDPLGSEHLAKVSGFIAEAESFPDAEADRVDAELAEDGRMPEERRPSHAALVGSNLGTDDRAPADDGIELRRECPEHGEYDEATGCPECSAKEPSAFTKLAQEEGIVPGPDETAPLPDGWESRAEQDLAREATTEVPKGLGGQLQEAAARRKVEDALIRAIGRATSVRGPGGLVDLHERAKKAGYWSDRVKAAATKRKLELR